MIFRPGEMVLVRQANQEPAGGNRNAAHVTESGQVASGGAFPISPPDRAVQILSHALGDVLGTGELTPVQQQLIAKFVSTQARTLPAEERKFVRESFRQEWVAKGFKLTPAIERLLQTDFTRQRTRPTTEENASYVEDQDDAVQLARDVEAAKRKLDEERKRWEDMTAQWSESNSAAAAGFAGEGTRADFGLATVIPNAVRELALKKVKLAELEYERAQLRWQLLKQSGAGRNAP
jgi:hypothetical protein